LTDLKNNTIFYTNKNEKRDRLEKKEEKVEKVDRFKK